MVVCIGRNLKSKNKKQKIKIVRGGTATAALSRRPYPPPASWREGGRTGCPQGFIHSCPHQLVNNLVCSHAVLKNLWITWHRLNIMNVVGSRPAFASGLTLMRLRQARARIVKLFWRNSDKPPIDYHHKCHESTVLDSTSTTLLESVNTRCFASLSASITLMRVSVTATSMRSP